MGVVGILGSDDLLSCFIVGNSFTWDDWFRLETEDDSFQAVIDGLLNVGIFIYLGTILPWSDFGNADIGLSAGKLVALAVSILALKRIPWILACWKWLSEIEDFKVSNQELSYYFNRDKVLSVGSTPGGSFWSYWRYVNEIISKQSVYLIIHL
jgi:NhaP-type Na+/H+ or K+/H+ antiporter